MNRLRYFFLRLRFPAQLLNCDNSLLFLAPELPSEY